MRLSAVQEKDIYEALDALAHAIGAPSTIETVLNITGSVPVRPRNTKQPIVYAHDPDVQAQARKVLFRWLEDRARSFTPLLEPL